MRGWQTDERQGALDDEQDERKGAVNERESLRDTAGDLARWQGKTEAQVNENSRRLDGINGSIARIEERQGTVLAEIATLKAKIGIYSAIGSLAGAGIVSAIFGRIG